MAVFREAGPGDLDGIRRLYRQLHPEDPVAGDGADVSGEAKQAYLARPS
ncbi:MAG: hypothetical protein JO016_01265 [Actinobacteria bacterium]|nr:hypothetical protein [Actinomycetota bacterium]